ncbi:hypothetical protein [Actinoplanes sp. RD1]|uniref:hypothetical protein n=1 Tax=Actinoplanes sp. RD1 TaxID=3064538 RepID=UPI002742870A|nr:hypothetical protein [Actinoplanes sp. RD1]
MKAAVVTAYDAAAETMAATVSRRPDPTRPLTWVNLGETAGPRPLRDVEHAWSRPADSSKRIVIH